MVSNTPCTLASVMVTSDGGGIADITLYNGESDQDEKVVTIKAGSGLTESIDLPFSVYLDKGLYVSLGSNVASVLVIYHSYKE